MTSQLNQPQNWTTGSDEPTDRQKAFLQTLAASHEGGEKIDPSSLNKSEASQKIDQLKNAPVKNPDAGPKGPDGRDQKGELLENPDSWATGADEATGKQMGYIATMARQAGESAPEGKMDKTEASKKIEDLKEKTGM